MVPTEPSASSSAARRRHQQQQQHQPVQPPPPPGTANVGAASSVEVYGFAGWIASAVAFVAFLLWAVLPESALHAMGVTYYPSKHWALAIPLWLVLLVLYVYWAYECVNMISVPEPSDLSTIHDPRAKWAEVVGLSSVQQSTLACVPPLVHVPLPVACRVLYGAGAPSVQGAERADHKWQIWSTLQSREGAAAAPGAGAAGGAAAAAAAAGRGGGGRAAETLH